MGMHLLDEKHNSRAVSVRRAVDGSRDLLDQTQIQGGRQLSGHGLYSQDSGPDSVRPMRFQAGPFFNPNGIDLEVVLGDRMGISYCEMIRDTSADNHMDMSIGARGFLTSDLDIGKERVDHLQSSEISAVKKRTVDEHDGRRQEGDDSASLPLDNSRLERPRKRGRPKKSKVDSPIMDSARMVTIRVHHRHAAHLLVCSRIMFGMNQRLVYARVVMMVSHDLATGSAGSSLVQVSSNDKCAAWVGAGPSLSVFYLLSLRCNPSSFCIRDMVLISAEYYVGVALCFASFKMSSDAFLQWSSPPPPSSRHHHRAVTTIESLPSQWTIVTAVPNSSTLLSNSTYDEPQPTTSPTDPLPSSATHRRQPTLVTQQHRQHQQ
ncbi:hypothetical protein Dimus_025008 [Dionaea muscipula]